MSSSREPLLSTLPEEIFRTPPKSPAERRLLPAVVAARRSELPTKALLRRGVVVDKYQIEEVLGVGGFAVVYRATHLLLRMPVALKLLRQEVLSQRPAMREQLLEEARFTARIHHPNVVRIYDATHSEDLTYIVMEYIEGASLSRRLQHGPLDLAAALRVGLDIASGLRAGLAQGLIHRDVKPANILISGDGTARLVDFGMAHPSFGDSVLESRTHPLVVGTRGYMSPEQAEDSARVDFRADIYSLGVTLFEATTGHRSGPSRKLPAAGSAELPPRLAELLRCMQSPTPERRPLTYDALIAELRAILREQLPAQAGRPEPAR